jgi:hypothetical protein
VFSPAGTLKRLKKKGYKFEVGCTGKGLKFRKAMDLREDGKLGAFTQQLIKEVTALARASGRKPADVTFESFTTQHEALSEALHPLLIAAGITGVSVGLGAKCLVSFLTHDPCMLRHQRRNPSSSG